MKISTNFTLEELTKTTAPYINVPSVMETLNLISLVKNVLQPLRELYGKPITVNSGYRSPLVNKHVGGAKTSQHVLGEAADIDTNSKEENKILFDLIRNNFEFDQLINEFDYSWIHVSYKSQGNRNEVLKKTKKGYEFC